MKSKLNLNIILGDLTFSTTLILYRFTVNLYNFNSCILDLFFEERMVDVLNALN